MQRKGKISRAVKQQKINEFIKKRISQEMGDSAGKEANNLRGRSHFPFRPVLAY